MQWSAVWRGTSLLTATWQDRGQCASALCVCVPLLPAALQFEPDGSVTAMLSEEGEKVTFAKYAKFTWQS
jgi:hypothetical protein